MERLRILLILCLIVSCSRVNVALDLAPRFTTEIVDDYFDLDSKKKSEVRDTIQKDIKELYTCCFKGAFAELDQEFASYKGGNAPKESTDRILSIYEKNKPPVVNHVKPDIEKFINSLSPKQLEYFEKEMRSNIEDDEEEVKDRMDKWEKTLDRFKRNFEFFCVPLEKGPMRKAEEFFNDRNFPYEERLKIKKALVAQMRNQTPEKKKELLLQYSLGEGFDRAVYQKAAKTFQRETIDFVLYLYNGLSTEKKKQCYDTFKGRVEELRVYFEDPKK